MSECAHKTCSLSNIERGKASLRLRGRFDAKLDCWLRSRTLVNAKEGNSGKWSSTLLECGLISPRATSLKTGRQASHEWVPQSPS
jgi:hypothetical protein